MITRPTEASTDPSEPAGDEGSSPPPARRAAGPFDGRVALLVALAVISAGWLLILWAHQFRGIRPPVFFLMLGWGALVMTTLLLARAAFALGMEEDPAVGGVVAIGEEELSQQELLAEKRALLKALKEVEFDHEMGKVSDEDAAEATRIYRARAIEVMKRLEPARRPAAGSETPAPASRDDRNVAAVVRGELARRLGEAVDLPVAAAAATPAAPSRACSGCATSNDADAQFCKKCGRPLEGAPDVQP